jgi:hypothetical protein
MFISSHEIEHLFSNEAQRLVYQRLRCRTKRRLCDMRSVPHSFFEHSSTQIPPHFSDLLTIVKFTHFSTIYHFDLLHIFLGTMMTIDQHDEFLPAFVMMSHTPCHVNIHWQYNGTHHNNNAQHGARYNSTKHTTVPLPGKSQHTHLSTVNAHNARPIDSAHFAQCHTIVHTVVLPSFTYITIVRLAVLVLYHTLVDSTLELSQM